MKRPPIRFIAVLEKGIKHLVSWDAEVLLIALKELQGSVAQKHVSNTGTDRRQAALLTSFC